jgi:acetyltransferase-like isoleucine patch superfamily enzyme
LEINLAMKDINESVLNYVYRSMRYIRARVMGWLYSKFLSDLNRPKKLLIGRNFKARNTKLINFNSKIKVGDNCRFECFPEYSSNSSKAGISIGKNTNFGNNVHIGAVGKITIAKDCLTGSNILIIDHNHGSIKDTFERENTPPKDRGLEYKGPIVIEKNVWLCDNVIILGGSTVKQGSTVPANTVVSGIYDNLNNNTSKHE